VPPLKHANVLVRDPKLSNSLPPKEEITEQNETKKESKEECPSLKESMSARQMKVVIAVAI
jgi:hypothetical protein